MGLWALFVIVLVGLNPQIVVPVQAAATPGFYPQGTIAFDGKTDRAIAINNVDKVPYTISLTSASKVCTVYVFFLKADSGIQAKAFDQFPGPRGTSNTAEPFKINGVLDGSKFGAGKYRMFIHEQTDCGGDPYGNDNDGFNCDGNPTCLSYCGGTAGGGKRTKIDSGQVFTPLNGGVDFLYRTSENSAYDAPYGSSSCAPGGPKVATGAWAANSCGEISGGPSCDNPASDVAERRGECEIVACDKSGNNGDNLAFTIGGGGSSANPSLNPSASAGTSANPSSSAATGGGAVTITLTSSTPGQATIPAGTVTTNLAAGTVINASAGISKAATDKTIMIASVNRNLVAYKGGNITTATDLTAVKLGDNSTVTIDRGVNILGVVDISSKDLPNVTVSLADKTTIFGSSKWDDGIIKPPVKIAPTLLLAPAGFTVGDVVIKVGSDKDTLILDQPATIIFKNTTGVPFYKNPSVDSQLTQIIACSTGTFEAVQPPAFPGECFYTNSSKTDIKIVTWHLTTFGTLQGQGPVMLSIDPGVCLDKKDPSQFLVQVEVASSTSFYQYYLARTACDSQTRCNGQEVVINPGKADPLLATTIPDFPPAGTKYYRYRVWGLLNGHVAATNALASQLDDQFWSFSKVVKVGCESLGGGINIKELVIPPQPSAKPRSVVSPTTLPTCGPGDTANCIPH